MSASPRDVDAGVLLLDGPLAPAARILVIRRTKPDDWSLPKGHVEQAESLEEAAERELLEETGYTGTLLGPAGAMAYRSAPGKTKCVTYFFFVRDGRGRSDAELDGVSELEWLSFEDAARRVTYADLSRFIRSVAPGEAGAATPASAPATERWRRRGVRRERLATAIDMYEQELQGLRARPRAAPAAGGSDPERASTWWRPPADALVHLARACSRHGSQTDSGWDALHSSQRLSLYELDDAEIAVRVEELRKEVESKLHDWRRASAIAALDLQGSWPPAALMTAQRLLDGHFANTYLRLRLAGMRILTSAALLTVTTGLLWLATVLGAFRGIGVPAPFVLTDAGLFGGILLLGMFGAMISLALSTKAPAERSRIFDLTMTRVAVPVARLALGAGAAVLVVATVQATIGANQPWVYLVAVPAGFSERLVQRSIESLESQVK